MSEIFTSYASSFFSWLWNWTQFLSYWIALLGGTGACILYIATKRRQFVSTSIILLLVYIMIQAVGAVI